VSAATTVPAAAPVAEAEAASVMVTAAKAEAPPFRKAAERWLPWECKHCTTVNNEWPSICDVCDTTNPEYERLCTPKELPFQSTAQIARQGVAAPPSA
jgi:hypothetical protein